MQRMLSFGFIHARLSVILRTHTPTLTFVQSRFRMERQRRSPKPEVWERTGATDAEGAPTARALRAATNEARLSWPGTLPDISLPWASWSVCLRGYDLLTVPGCVQIQIACKLDQIPHPADPHGAMAL